jgi:hypothetical protein
MIQLSCGNVLLKPSARRQLMATLKRATKLGERVGSFAMNLCLKRSGRTFDVRADVRDRAGAFRCHARGSDWASVVRNVVRDLVIRLHAQLIARTLTPAIA